MEKGCFNMSKKDSTIKERLAVLETLMTNHLQHHNVYLKGVLIPIGLMVLYLALKAVIPDLEWAIQFIR
jgi:hypothetical protein